MTLDGVNIQDNTLKTTDGFFATVGPRLDAVEEISFTTAASGAESTGSGATQIRYTTKSGTNGYHGGVFHQYRSDALNANIWFNERDGLAQAGATAQPAGVQPWRSGHAARLQRPQQGLLLRQLRGTSAAVGSAENSPMIFTPDAERGIFRYSTAAGVQTVNLFELAARSGQTATPDPITSRLLADIRNATTKEGNVRDLTDPLYQEYALPGAAAIDEAAYPTV